MTPINTCNFPYQNLPRRSAVVDASEDKNSNLLSVLSASRSALMLSVLPLY